MSVIHGVKCDKCGRILDFKGHNNSGFVIYRAKEQGWKGGHRIADTHICPTCQKNKPEDTNNE